MDHKTAMAVEARNAAAHEAEVAGDLEKAASLYEETVSMDIPDQYAFDRLMIIYRKQKEFAKEQKVIRKGIALFQEKNKRPLKESVSAKKNKSQLVRLSNAFMKGTGLIDKKGNEKFIPEPINKWMKRLEVVQKKVKAKK